MPGRRSTTARTCLAGLALATLAVDVGCSHLRSRFGGSKQAAPAVGSEMASRDIYDKGVRAETPVARATVAPEAEPGLADSTPPGNLIPAEPTVRLQPPTAIDPGRARPEAAPVSLPDSGRLASSSAANPADSAVADVAQAGHVEPDEASRVVGEARIALDSMASYQLALRRQERVGNVLLPVEDLEMSVRRAPKAVRLTWADGPHKGREVLYRVDEPGGMMHVNMADSKLPIPRLTLPVDSPMVMKNSRHPISEAGLDPIVNSLELSARAGSLADLGMQTPPQLDRPHRGVLRRTAEGEVWRAYFDPTTHLPALVECQAANGDLLESYRFRDVRPDPVELAAADAFDPDARWGAPRSLFGRVAAKNSATAPTAR